MSPEAIMDRDEIIDAMRARHGAFLVHEGFSPSAAKRARKDFDQWLAEKKGSPYLSDGSLYKMYRGMWRPEENES